MFADLDVLPNPVANHGGTDPVRRLTWVTNGSNLYLGVMAIQTAQAMSLANATLVSNPTYVWPNQYLLDFDRTEFLRGVSPAHRMPVSVGPSDYSALVSVGPLTLPAAGHVDVVFAVVGGTSLAELLAHADEAQQNYVQATAGIDPDPSGPVLDLLALSVSPNPFAGEAAVSFRLASAGPVDLSVFDAAGRRIRRLASGELPAGAHQLRWDGRDDGGNVLPRSMYFVRLANRDGKKVTRVTYVR